MNRWETITEPATSDKTTVTFVCLQNAGRSQVASAFAQRERDERGLDDELELVTVAVPGSLVVGRVRPPGRRSAAVPELPRPLVRAGSEDGVAGRTDVLEGPGALFELDGRLLGGCDVVVVVRLRGPGHDRLLAVWTRSHAGASDPATIAVTGSGRSP
jgi:hypothetical protein